MLENTLVVFLSDHGDNLGSHGNFNKDILLEESIRIPLIFWWPGRLVPQVHARQIAQMIDVMPTLLGLCGLAAPGGVQGRSLAPVLRGDCAELPNNAAFIETPTHDVGLRTPTHLYGMSIDRRSRALTGERLYFFDMAADPYQQRNLAGTTEQAETAERLRRRLIDWHERTPWFSVDDPPDGGP